MSAIWIEIGHHSVVSFNLAVIKTSWMECSVKDNRDEGVAHMHSSVDKIIIHLDADSLDIKFTRGLNVDDVIIDGVF